MKRIFKIIVIILLNAAAFLGIANFLPGFELKGGLSQVILIALVFTLLNFILKPVLKLILGPVIVLTLGLGLLLINMILLYILDGLINNLTIDGVLTLFYASIIVGIINFFVHLVPKK